MLNNNPVNMTIIMSGLINALDKVVKTRNNHSLFG